jgi:hypothetical protein
VNSYNKYLTSTWQEYIVIFLVIGFVGSIPCFIGYDIATRKEYSIIVDDQGIERKCIVTTTFYSRDTYMEENGNVVLVIDRTKE